MKKTDFCPYDGKPIHPGNLAYELVFSEGWNWDRVRKETPAGEDRKLYVSENDSRRKHFSSGAAFDHPVILLENRSSGGKNGLALLCERLTGSSPAGTSGGGYEDFIRSRLRDVELSRPIGIRPEYGDTDKLAENGSPQIRYSMADGVCCFYDKSDEMIMKAVPCCPHCHRRLPEGWLEADDFIGVSVIAPEGSGKTAFIDSLIHSNCEAFRGIPAVSGRALTFTAVPESSNGAAFIRAELTGAGGKKTLIAGIYDASEYLTADGRYKRGVPDGDIMSRMDADIYLFDIRQMGIAGIDAQKIAGRTEYRTCRMLSMEEQAEYQRKNAGKVIHAAELLKARISSVKNKDKQTRIEGFYNHFADERRKYEHSRINNMQFAGVINKIDLIEEKEKKGRFAALFDRNSDYDMADVNSMSARTMLATELMNKYHMLADRNLRDCGSGYGKGVSWHCISALGCDALDDGTLTGAYDPIRTAEPVVLCIMRRFAENEWI